jgi:formylglycine-generating enzyme
VKDGQDGHGIILGIRFHPGACITTDQPNFNGNYVLNGCQVGVYRSKTIPVASFSPNTWGLFDMLGNVWEWCEDWYGQYPTGAVVDPEGPFSGTYGIFRGGSWIDTQAICRSARRGFFYLTQYSTDIGFLAYI